MGRYFGVRPSQLLKIDDEVMAFDFDLLCTTRLLLHDAEQTQIQTAALLSETMGAMSGGVPTGTGAASKTERIVEEW